MTNFLNKIKYLTKKLYSIFITTEAKLIASEIREMSQTAWTEASSISHSKKTVLDYIGKSKCSKFSISLSQNMQLFTSKVNFNPENVLVE